MKVGSGAKVLGQLPIDGVNGIEIWGSLGPGIFLLIDFKCYRKPKLMERWKKSYEKIDSKDTLVAHATIFAFKFPDQAYVHMTCNVEVYISLRRSII